MLGETEEGGMAFDPAGFKRLLESTAGEKNFHKMVMMVRGLAKGGAISAEDAKRYTMDIEKEFRANTQPTQAQINNYINNNSGCTSMLMGSKAANDQYITLTDY